MEVVRDILEHKGSRVVSVSRDTSVREALRLMEKENIGAVLVLDPNGHSAGVFSERDYARKMPSASPSREDTPVAEVMSSKVWTVTPTKSIEEAMAIMKERGLFEYPYAAGVRPWTWYLTALSSGSTLFDAENEKRHIGRDRPGFSGEVRMRVLVNGLEIYSSPKLCSRTRGVSIDVPVMEYDLISLVSEPWEPKSHGRFWSVWADARFMSKA